MVSQPCSSGDVIYLDNHPAKILSTGHYHFLRLVISSVFLFLMIYLFGRSEKIRRKDLGLSSSVHCSIRSCISLEKIPVWCSQPGRYFCCYCHDPCIFTGGRLFFFKERISFINVIGILLCFAGLLVMLVNRHFSLSVDPRGLYFWQALYSLHWSTRSSQTLTRDIRRFHWSPGRTWSVFPFSPLLPVVWFKRFRNVSLNGEIVISLFLLAILASSVSFVCYAITVKSLG